MFLTWENRLNICHHQFQIVSKLVIEYHIMPNNFHATCAAPKCNRLHNNAACNQMLLSHIMYLLIHDHNVNFLLMSKIVTKICQYLILCSAVLKTINFVLLLKKALYNVMFCCLSLFENFEFLRISFIVSRSSLFVFNLMQWYDNYTVQCTLSPERLYDIDTMLEYK